MEHVFRGKPTGEDLATLRALAAQYPSLDATLAEIARLSAELVLPKGTVHIISDVHGEDAKLRHVINNASGRLRPMIERLFADRMSASELQEFIALVFYPSETLKRISPKLNDAEARRDFYRKTFHHVFEILRILGARYSIVQVRRAFPEEYRVLFSEFFYDAARPHGDEHQTAIVDSLLENDRAKHVLRLAVRVVRDLTIYEQINAGDFWDRGPRGDRVMSYVARQPNIAITWGNHDAAWLGACVGQPALVAHVLRISLRYGRLEQLEEGYGIALQPLENLVEAVYRDDPADCYKPKNPSTRDPLTMARMQKAAAIMQFKLDSAVIQRNPHFLMDNRRLLHQIDAKNGMITIDGVRRTLRDRHFPTIDPADPYRLSPEEERCLKQLRESFLTSQTMWEHMTFMLERGSMYLVRDDNLIFHGCVPVDDQGDFLNFEIDGKPYCGRALFDILEQVVPRALEQKQDSDLDLLWYLWQGARSPLFGKDRITTLENDLVVEKETHVETKNPYFSLIHEVDFCDRILKEFGVNPERGLIVNGHVPVKIEQGESPMKRSGKAITIDGAFSEAYGDHGYTLLLEPERTLLATHHHFESVEAAVRDGIDIIPDIEVIREWPTPRRVGDTERGSEIRSQIALLQRLAHAYRTHALGPR